LREEQLSDKDISLYFHT